MIKQKYPGAVSSKSVKDKELERKREQKRKPGEGNSQEKGKKVKAFPVAEKNEGSKLSSTWRPANDYVNLKVLY